MKSDIDTIELSELAQSYIDKNLSVNAEYQRGASWNVKQQRALIDSILKGFILPIFYVHVVKRPNTFTRSETVTAYLVDGQQRLNAITEFMRGRFSLADAASAGSSAISAYEKKNPPRWAGQRFDELSEEDRTRFLKHPLSVVRMEEQKPNEVRDLFIRLQSGTPLNPQEKRDAWPGDFTVFVIKHAGKDKHPASNPHPFFDLVKHAVARTGEGEESVYLDNRANTRKFFAGLAMTYIVRQESELDFVDLKATTIDSFYQHKTDLPNDDTAVVRLLKLLSEVASLPEIQRIQGNKLRFQWAFHLVFLVDSLSAAGYVDATWRSKLVDAFEGFRAACAVAAKESKAGQRSRHYTEFVQLLSGSGSDTADNIRRRHRFLLLEIIDALKPRARDPQRIFGPVEREILWYRQGGKCAHPECQQPTALAEMHAHHIEEHSQGGVTTLQNGVLVCRSCHQNRADMQSLEVFFRNKVTDDLAPSPAQPQTTEVEIDDIQPKKLRIAVDWPKLGKGDTVQVFHEAMETNTLVKFCGALIDAYGPNAIKWLTETPITRYAISKEPLVTFKNPVSGGAYSHRAIEKTGYYLCTISSQEEKLKKLLSWIDTTPPEVRAHVRVTVE
jgi:hypothetical protein